MKTAAEIGLEASALKSLVEIFAKDKKIKKALLYGSRALGNFKPGSDIDITLVAPQMTLQELFQIESEIEALGLIYKVDLSLLHKVENASLIAHIERVGIELNSLTSGSKPA